MTIKLYSSLTYLTAEVSCHCALVVIIQGPKQRELPYPGQAILKQREKGKMAKAL